MYAVSKRSSSLCEFVDGASGIIAGPGAKQRRFCGVAGALKRRLVRCATQDPV